VKKVCIFDWDIHVGDGTGDIFYEDDSVLYLSIHRFDNGVFYPGPAGKYQKTGEGKGRGYNIHFPYNVEKSSKTIIGDHDYIYALEQVFAPVIKEFAPDLLIISAGFDSALGDPLG
jgi:histone deacetylase 6